MKALLLTALMLLSGLPTATAMDLTVRQLAEDLMLVKNTDRFATNIGVVLTPDGAVLIDPNPEQPCLEQFARQLQKIVEDRPVFILNTHSHADHAGGNAFFQARGATLVDGPMDEIAHRIVKSHSNADHLYFHQPSNTLFVGDVVDASWHPTFYAGGIDGFVEAMETILAIGNEQTIIVPGHGSLINKAYVRDYKQNTAAWVERVRQLHERQQTVEQMLHDETLLSILNTFNTQGLTPFLPEKALTRFIARTIDNIDN